MTVKRLVERPVVRPRPVPGAETSGGFEGHLNDLDSTVLRDLLLRSAVGDQEAFEQFYRLTSPVLMAVIAARRLPSPAVDTLVVETYVAIWCHAPAFAGTGHSLWQWTLTILTDVLSRPLPEQDRPRSTGRPQPTLRPAGRAATTSFWRRRKDRGISMTLDGSTGPNPPGRFSHAPVVSTTTVSSSKTQPEPERCSTRETTMAMQIVTHDTVTRSPRVRPSLSPSEQVVMGLPSLVLGLVPLLAPAPTARAIGVGPHPRTLLVLRLIGLRELAVALAFLGRGSPRWLWGFVAQDAVDIPLCWWLLARRRPADPGRLRSVRDGYLALAIVDLYAALTRNVAPDQQERGVVEHQGRRT